MTPRPEERHTQNRIETLSRRQDTARRSREELEARVEVLEQQCVDLSRLVLRLVDDDLPTDLLAEGWKTDFESDESLSKVIERLRIRAVGTKESVEVDAETSTNSYL